MVKETVNEDLYNDGKTLKSFRKNIMFRLFDAAKLAVDNKIRLNLFMDELADLTRDAEAYTIMLMNKFDYSEEEAVRIAFTDDMDGKNSLIDNLDELLAFMFGKYSSKYEGVLRRAMKAYNTQYSLHYQNKK